MSVSTPPDTEARLGQPEEPVEPGKMSIFEHLGELRTRIIRSAMGIAVGTCVGIYVAKPVLTFAAKPMVTALQNAGLGNQLIFTHPAGYVNLWIQTALYVGLVLALPYVLYQIWLFVAPGLHKNERGAIAGFIIPAFLLFLGGIVFAYYILLPYLMRFLVTFQGLNGPFRPLISVEEYYDLTITILIGVGLVFELPAVIFLLSMFGLVTPQFLWKNFKYAVLVISIVAAVITPTPDATTMLVFMSPMILLYLVSIAVSALAVRRRNRNREAAA